MIDKIKAVRLGFEEMLMSIMVVLLLVAALIIFIAMGLTMYQDVTSNRTQKAQLHQITCHSAGQEIYNSIGSNVSFHSSGRIRFTEADSAKEIQLTGDCIVESIQNGQR